MVLLWMLNCDSSFTLCTPLMESRRMMEAFVHIPKRKERDRFCLVGIWIFCAYALFSFEW